MVQVGSLYFLYSGDIDSQAGDGNINGADYSVWELDDSNFETGYNNQI
ncbi:MAG: hypothetical protein IPK25_13385 [Saprospiraceae bacterium]|nr:hypothetical protein [Saprospiraceae bacterium]